MLSGPAILRISILLLIAGVLAALVQYLLPADPTPTAAEPPLVERRAGPAASAPASPAAPEPAPARRPDPPASPAQMPTDALAFPPPAAAPPAPSPRATAPPVPASTVPAATQPPPPRGEAEIAQAEDNAGPRAVALVDLNTASVADLNRLQGVGAIGRSIVSKRPYTSIDQLLGKRVLSRAVYDRIKAQVTVR